MAAQRGVGCSGVIDPDSRAETRARTALRSCACQDCGRDSGPSSGRPIFVHYIRGRTDVHAERLGVLARPCGNLTRTLQRAFPFRPVPGGRYRLLFNTSPNPNRAPQLVTRLITVRKRDAIPAR